MAMTLLSRPRAPVWVLGGERGGSDALALAGRLDLPFLRVPDVAAVAADHGPSLVVSSGSRGAIRALALRTRFDCRLVHCVTGPSPFLPHDLVVRASPVRLRERKRLLPVLGPIGVVSPSLLGEARQIWAERLDHLPRPFTALVIRRGGERPLSPALGLALASSVAGLMRAVGGSVLASIDAASGTGLHEAVRRGLSGALHLLYRTDEPGEDPTLGFIGSADTVVIGGAAAATLAEAASADAPVFVDALDDFARLGRRLLATLVAEDHVRPFSGSLSPWPRPDPLDETGRAAQAIRVRLGL